MAEHWTRAALRRIADQVGTPFYLYDAATLRARIGAIREVAAGEGLQARYAMKACSAAKVLEEIARAGVWIDAVSGNEVLRARRAGFPMGAEPPVVLLTTDVFRDNALAVVRDERVLPNVGSPGMVRELADAGYRGPIGLRVNPGFAQAARRAGMSIVLLHAHVGSGPQIDELYANLQRLAHFFAGLLAEFPDCRAINLGGGIPHSYRDPAWTPDLVPLRKLIEGARASFSERAGRPIRVEIEPGRFFIAPAATLVARVADVKYTRSNDKGRGHGFIMVDAGFCDLVRPAMYGSFHRISVVSEEPGPEAPFAVAGPLCESGDVFTRDAAELIEPRSLPTPQAGDFVLLHDAGAYGAAMSSNYNSLGRVPQVWVENGAAYRMSRRETVEDLMRTECFERLS